MIASIDKQKAIPPADLDALHLRMQTALEITDRLVKVIGNAVGAVEERKGKLYQDKTAEKLTLRNVHEIT